MSHANVHESNQTFTFGSLAAPQKQHFSAILSVFIFFFVYLLLQQNQDYQKMKDNHNAVPLQDRIKGEKLWRRQEFIQTIKTESTHSEFNVDV